MNPRLASLIFGISGAVPEFSKINFEIVSKIRKFVACAISATLPSIGSGGNILPNEWNEGSINRGRDQSVRSLDN